MLYTLKPTEERVSRLTSAATIADVLDHATSEFACGSKLGLDATKKIPSESFKRPLPPLSMRHGVAGQRDTSQPVAADMSPLKL